MIWHRQAYEDDAAWDAFCAYLDAPTPRVLDMLCAAEGGKLDIWRNWSEGRNTKGGRIADALSWSQRASAYDAWRESQQDEESLAEMLAEDKSDYRLQLAKWREVWERAQFHQQKRVTRKREGGEEIEVVVVALAVKDWLLLTQWRQAISEFGRSVRRKPAK